MKRLLITDLKRGLKNKYFLPGTAGLVLAGILGMDSIYSQMNHSGIHIDGLKFFHFAQTGSSSSVYLTLLPLFVALPFSSCIKDDIKSGFSLYYVSRSGKIPYLFSKITASFLIGALMAGVSTLFLYAGCFGIFFPAEMEVQDFLQNKGSYLQIGMTGLGLGVLNGGVWSVFSVFLSMVLNNKYMGWGAPFILYYILVAFQERYYEKLIYLNPMEWASPQLTDFRLDFMILIIVSFVISLGTFLYAERRLV